MEDSALYASDSPGRRQMNTLESLETSGEPHCKQVNRVDPLSFLAGVALAPSSDKEVKYRCLCEGCRCLEVLDLHSANLQLRFFISRTDDIYKNLIKGVSERESIAASLPSFLFTCRPYFNYLESTARSTLSESTCSQLLDCSEALVNKLENLLLAFASNELLSLDETEPNSISHFHIGQCGLGPLRVTIFRYCQPTPYLGQANMYKRMRWNVDRREEAMLQIQKEDEMKMDYTEYYFLCFEDINTLPEGDHQSISYGNVVRVWSIGQWIQILPETNDINDWILCKIPQGTYLKLMILGTEEPSCRYATDCLLDLLMVDQKNSNQ